MLTITFRVLNWQSHIYSGQSKSRSLTVCMSNRHFKILSCAVSIILVFSFLIDVRWWKIHILNHEMSVIHMEATIVVTVGYPVLHCASPRHVRRPSLTEHVAQWESAVTSVRQTKFFTRIIMVAAPCPNGCQGVHMPRIAFGTAHEGTPEEIFHGGIRSACDSPHLVCMYCMVGEHGIASTLCQCVIHDCSLWDSTHTAWECCAVSPNQRICTCNLHACDERMSEFIGKVILMCSVYSTQSP